MIQTTSCLVHLCMCVAVQVLFSADVNSVIQKNSLPRGVPNSDVEFYTNYLNFLNSRNHEVYLPFAIVCIIVGIVGNGCFLFFFGNPTSQVYLTRDALYFRRLAVADLFICVFIIPYSVVFEAKLVGSATLCKTLEYTRHVMVFFSHLLLVSYSVEFNEEDNYPSVKRRLDRSTFIVSGIACIISLPVLVIFDVGATPGYDFLNMTFSQQSWSGNLPVNDRSTARPVKFSNFYSTFSPNFCHILLNYDVTAKYYHTINIMKSIYIMTFGFILFASTILLISKFIQFVDDNPLIGRQSAFVSFIETDNPDVSDKLQRLSVHVDRQSHSRRQSGKTAVDNSRKPSINRADPLPETVASSSEPAKMQPKTVNKPDSTPIDNIVMEPLKRQSSDKNVENMGTSTDVEPPIPSAPNGKKDKRNSPAQCRFSLDDTTKETMSNTDYELFVHPVSRRGSRRRSRDASDMPISLLNFLFHCECFRSRGKSIHSVRHPFKMAIAYLIVGDILVACAAVVFYQISEEMSVVTNLIHLKSVFAFYVISFFHRDLRRATWGLTKRSNSCC